MSLEALETLAFSVACPSRFESSEMAVSYFAAVSLKDLGVLRAIGVVVFTLLHFIVLTFQLLLWLEVLVYPSKLP